MSAVATKNTLLLNTEDALVDQLVANDPRAFETLVREYGPRLLSVTRKFLSNEDDAQDALQDAFISVFKSIHRFERGAKLSSWLYGIAVNAALMKLRSRSRRHARAIDDLLPNYTEDGRHAELMETRAEPVEEIFDRGETRERVRQRIDMLPERYKTVLLLRDILEHSTDETAKILKISNGAVKVRLHRARQALRTLLLEQKDPCIPALAGK